MPLQVKLNRGPFRLALRSTVAAFVLMIFLFCGFRAYTVYLTRRAILLLDQAASIRIGDTEDSILPLVGRYRSIKEAPPPLEPSDDCAATAGEICLQSPPQSRADLEYLRAHLPDYTYVIEISPFDVFALRHQQFRGPRLALAYLMFRTPILLRNLVSLRDWDAFANISIRGGRVQRVTGGLYVEGDNRWLGHSWHLSADAPSPEMPQNTTYRADSAFLELNTGGFMTDQHITSAATTDQVRAAHSINIRCVTNLIPCSDVSDLSPRAFEYKKLHPEADSHLP